MSYSVRHKFHVNRLPSLTWVGAKDGPLGSSVRHWHCLSLSKSLCLETVFGKHFKTYKHMPTNNVHWSLSDAAFWQMILSFFTSRQSLFGLCVRTTGVLLIESKIPCNVSFIIPYNKISPSSSKHSIYHSYVINVLPIQFTLDKWPLQHKSSSFL